MQCVVLAVIFCDGHSCWHDLAFFTDVLINTDSKYDYKYECIQRLAELNLRCSKIDAKQTRRPALNGVS